MGFQGDLPRPEKAEPGLIQDPWKIGTIEEKKKLYVSLMDLIQSTSKVIRLSNSWLNPMSVLSLLRSGENLSPSWFVLPAMSARISRSNFVVSSPLTCQMHFQTHTEIGFRSCCPIQNLMTFWITRHKTLSTVVMDVPEIIGLYNVKSILTDNSI